ncbi:MAG: glycosyltransferase [Planctomycetota bacterium]
MSYHDELRWSVVIPTYRRPDVLHLCLQALEKAIPDPRGFEVLVYDNGFQESSREVGAPFTRALNLRYTDNEPGHGLGYSLSRGAVEARGQYIVELNDDAIVPLDFFARVGEIFESDSQIGVIGVRAIEADYASDNRPIGFIDKQTAEIVANFDRSTDTLVDVEHVYGFCYAYRREILQRGAVHDPILLTRDYSTAAGIETDHCLLAGRLGYRVVYDGRIAAEHLAKPRPDIDERSLQWKLNHWRNLFYLYLKHFGWFGGNALALRFALKDIGLLSCLRQPTIDNLKYFLTGLRARGSAVWHWLKFKLSPRTWRPLTD